MTTTLATAASTAPLLKWVFWSIAAFDGVLLLVLIISTLTHDGGGHNDGGRETGIFFFLIVPGVG